MSFDHELRQSLREALQSQDPSAWQKAINQHRRTNSWHELDSETINEALTYMDPEFCLASDPVPITEILNGDFDKAPKAHYLTQSIRLLAPTEEGPWQTVMSDYGPIMRALSLDEEGQRAVRASLSRLSLLEQIEFIGAEGSTFETGLLESLGSCSRLEELRFIHCRSLSDADLGHIAKLSSLKRLYLPGSQNASLLDWEALGALDKLESLAFGEYSMPENPDSFVLSAVPTLSALKSLQFWWAQDVGPERFNTLSRFTKLESLSVSFSMEFLGLLPKTVEALPELKHIKVASCPRFANDGFAFMEAAQALETLDLVNCKNLNDRDLINISKAKRLRSLTLNRLGQMGDKGFEALAALQELETLSLENLDGLKQPSRDLWRNLEKLKTLKLHHSRSLNDDILQDISKAPNLTFLSLSNCPNIKDAGLQPFLDKSNQCLLHIHDCRLVSEAALKALAALQN